jgi:hypothetical protein
MLPSRFAFPALLVLSLTLGACGSDTTAASSIAGAYHATTFQVTVAGGNAMDALAAGGSLTLQVNADNTTSGTLSLPASITGGSAFTASMAGTASVSGNTVFFQQSADTFVRDLTWTINGNTITVSSQSLGGAIYTIVLTR